MRIDELRLDELTGYRGNPIYKLFQEARDIDTFARRLEESGYDVKKLGQGVFGIVFEKPGGKDVYKVFTARDKGYLSFLKYAKANQDNPHLPRIYGNIMRVEMPLNNIRSQGKDWIIVRLEKLQPSDDAYPDEHQIGNYLQFTPMPSPEEIEELDNNGLLDMEMEMALEFQREYPQLAEVLDWVNANANRVQGIHIDLHDENFMQRGDTVVITDPYSYFGD